MAGRAPVVLGYVGFLPSQGVRYGMGGRSETGSDQLPQLMPLRFIHQWIIEV